LKVDKIFSKLSRNGGLMKISNSSRIEIWQQHLKSAESYPAGITTYLSDQGLNPSTFYRWRDIILKQNQKVSIVKPKKKTKQKPSKFLPVIVAPSLSKLSAPQSCRQLPDAKWLAEVILEIHARCL
jgi:hypothetical protein